MSLENRQLPGICFWREGRGNEDWAEYMREKGGDDSAVGIVHGVT